LRVPWQNRKRRKPQKRLVGSKNVLLRSMQKKNIVKHRKGTSHLCRRRRKRSFQDKVIEEMRVKAPHLF